MALPEHPEEIRALLSSVCLKILPPVAVSRMLDHYGKEVLPILLADPLQLAELPGVAADKVLAASDALHRHMTLVQTGQWLAETGVPVQFAQTLVSKLGPGAPEQLRENPYVMLDAAEQITFAQADVAARSRGGALESQNRSDAAVRWLLRQAEANGHVCLPLEVLEKAAGSLLSIPETPVRMGGLPFDVLVETEAPEHWVYRTSVRDMEVRAVLRLSALKRSSGAATPNGKLRGEDWALLEEIAPWGWDPIQQEVFEAAASRAVTVVTGGPGTGKTTLIMGLVTLFTSWGATVMLAAPTGRAARRMADATGMEAKTVHRLLEVAYDVSEGEPIRFRKDAGDPLEAEVLIVDEASMLDLALFDALLQACRDGTRIILVGDADQLPSVGAGRVLADLIESGTIPMIRLGQVFRQTDGSRIAGSARAILEGRFPEFSEEWGECHLVRAWRAEQVADAVVKLCKNLIPEQYGFDPHSDIQVLAPMRKGKTGVLHLNQLLQKSLNPDAQKRAGLLCEGDRVMQNRNDYRQPWCLYDEKGEPFLGEGVYNGDLGTLVSFDKKHRMAVVQFDDGREAAYQESQLVGLEHAYAMTVHKSQGSEYPVVVLPLHGIPEPLACRHLLYTAVSRARKMLVIVGTEATLQRMIENDRNLERYSGLSWRLQRNELEREGR